MQETSLPRVFKLFRALGLRHLVVVDDENRVGVVLLVMEFNSFSACVILTDHILYVMIIQTWLFFGFLGGWTGDQERLG